MGATVAGGPLQNPFCVTPEDSDMPPPLPWTLLTVCTVSLPAKRHRFPASCRRFAANRRQTAASLQTITSAGCFVYRAQATGNMIARAKQSANGSQTAHFLTANSRI